MKLKFLGAAKTVTGSFFVVETADVTFAVDCGLFQGPKVIEERNYQTIPIFPGNIDFMIVTHAHIDHIGRIPWLFKQGFKGNIYCSQVTSELASVLLPDAAHIQETETERENRKRTRAGKKLKEPLYTVQDALDCMQQFRAINHDEIIEIHDKVQVRLRDAGHILGSAIVEVWIEENHEKEKFVFSGDLGNKNQPIVKDPSIIESADYLILESTYGNRCHKEIGNRSEQLKEVIEFTMRKGGNLIIPAFAVERTQDLLLDLSILYNAGQLDPGIQLYIDSPLAIAATKIFQDHVECYDDEAKQIMAQYSHPLKLPNLCFSETQEQSMELNRVQRNAIIISASGMCDAGRIKHHLRYNLWRPESTILFVGYQAVGTLGRRLIEGEKQVNIFGDKIAVKADIVALDAYSAHADHNGLIDWVKNFTKLPKTIFLVHGEEEGQKYLADTLKKEVNTPVYIPEWQEEIDLHAQNELPSKLESADYQLNKALQAEKMYLDVCGKLHEIYSHNWNNANYDEIIEYLQKIASMSR